MKAAKYILALLTIGGPILPWYSEPGSYALNGFFVSQASFVIVHYDSRYGLFNMYGTAVLLCALLALGLEFYGDMRGASRKYGFIPMVGAVTAMVVALLSSSGTSLGIEAGLYLSLLCGGAALALMLQGSGLVTKERHSYDTRTTESRSDPEQPGIASAVSQSPGVDERNSMTVQSAESPNVSDARVNRLLNGLQERVAYRRIDALNEIGREKLTDPRIVGAVKTLTTSDSVHTIREIAQQVLDSLGLAELRNDASEKPAAMPAAIPSPQPVVVPSAESASADKRQRARQLAEKYIGMDHPCSAIERAMGIQSRPSYRIFAGDRIGRESFPGVDAKTVSVASCLPSKHLNLHDVQAIASLAMQAIQHYAALPRVQAFFLLPYHLRTGVISPGASIPAQELCRLYGGVENLMLEIYEELSEGEVVTDNRVERKIDRLLDSIQ